MQHLLNYILVESANRMDAIRDLGVTVGELGEASRVATGEKRLIKTRSIVAETTLDCDVYVMCRGELTRLQTATVMGEVKAEIQRQALDVWVMRDLTSGSVFGAAGVTQGAMPDSVPVVLVLSPFDCTLAVREIRLSSTHKNAIRELSLKGGRMGNTA